MVTITKALIAGLTFGAVNAYPQAANPSISMSYNTAPQPVPTTAPPSPTEDAEKKAALFRDLFTAPTAIKRFQRLLTAKGEALLSGETLRSLTVFNFNGAKPAGWGKGGFINAANIETFPILTRLGISTSVGFLDPCGLNTPHVHPRASEFHTVVEGTENFGFILENGPLAAGQNPEIAGTLGKFEGTVFPMGSIHYQFNPKCERAVFVAGLNSEDPGTSQVAQNFFNLNAGVLNATLGFPKNIDGKNIEEFRKAIPANIAQDIDNCLAKCLSEGYNLGESVVKMI